MSVVYFSCLILMYIPLHGRSTFSFLEAIGTPKIIMQKAKELWFSAIALTDLDVMYGMIQWYQAGHDQKIKPIFGVEIGFVLDVNNIPNSKAIGSLCLLAFNDQGYLNLMKLVSFAGEEGIAHRPKVDMQVLEQYKEGILIFSGGTDSWIAKMLNNAEPLPKIQEIREMLQMKFWSENCYLEIIAQDEKIDSELAKVNQTVLELAKITNTPCLVSNIYSYPSPEDAKTQELAMAIKDNLKLYDPQHRVPTTKNHLMVEQEIKAICLENGYTETQIDERIATTQAIADRCNAKIEMGQGLFPKYEAEPEILELYEKNKQNLVVE